MSEGNKKYSSRIWNDKIKFFRPRFEKALDKKYSKIEEKDRRQQFINDYRKIYFDDEHDIDTRIKSWFDVNKKTMPDVERLLNICNMLDCDIDYFTTSSSIMKNNNIDAIKRTGLSEEAINNISNMDSEKKQLLDYLLSEKGMFYYILDCIIRIIKPKRNTPVYYDEANREFKEANTTFGNTRVKTLTLANEKDLSDNESFVINDNFIESIYIRQIDKIITMELKKKFNEQTP